MNEKFTPGPWVREETTLSGDVIRDESGKRIAVTVPQSDGFVGYDAALIAAAPELYEAACSAETALTVVAANIRSHLEGHSNDLEELARMADRAREYLKMTRAKARGEK